MAKKKKEKLTINEKLALRLVEEADNQRWRLTQLISMFHPDGALVDIIDGSQIGKVMLDSPACKRFSEDDSALNKCLDILVNTRKKESASIDVDFFCTILMFQDNLCYDFEACIMFKVTPDDAPIYIKEGYNDDSIMLRFLVSGELNEAFLVLEDLDAKDNLKEFRGNISSFIRLSEFHAVVARGYDYETADPVDIMVSYSQAEGKCVIESIFDRNKKLIDPLIPPYKPNEDSDESVTDAGSQVEAVSVAPEDKLGVEDNDAPTPSSDKDSRIKALKNTLNKKRATRLSKSTDSDGARVCDVAPIQDDTAPCPDPDSATDADDKTNVETTTDTEAQESK